MSEEFIKVTDTRTHGRTDTRTEPLPELLSELKKEDIKDLAESMPKPEITYDTEDTGARYNTDTDQSLYPTIVGL